MNPQSVTALLTVKDDDGRYLLDMLQGPAGSLTWNGDTAARATTNPSLGGIWPQGHEGGNLNLFGVPVIQSTQCPAGTGIMLSVRSGAAVYWVRLAMLIIFDPYTGLSNNTFRWVAESRVSLSTPRPAAINIISNLAGGVMTYKKLPAEQKTADDTKDPLPNPHDPVTFVGDGEERRPTSVIATQINEAKAKDAGQPVKVKVKKPFRVIHEATVYTGGDVVEVPSNTADEWIAARWAEPVAAKTYEGEIDHAFQERASEC